MPLFDRLVDDRPGSLSEARHWVTGLVHLDVTGSSLDALLVVVTELLANAHRHGGTPPCRLRVTLREGSVRIEVTDATAAAPPPSPRLPAGDAESGRGLLLVEALSSRWGSRPHGPGTCVWAEVPAEEPAP